MSLKRSNLVPSSSFASQVFGLFLKLYFFLCYTSGMLFCTLTLIDNIILSFFFFYSIYGLGHYRKIVELGCGLGLTGLIICKTCTPTKYVFTDNNHQVIRTLQENLEINGIQVQQLKNGSGDEGVNLSGQGTRQPCLQKQTSDDVKCEDVFCPNKFAQKICEESSKICKSYLQRKPSYDIMAESELHSEYQHPCTIAQCMETICKANCRSEEELHCHCNGSTYMYDTITKTKNREKECHVAMATLDWETVDDSDFEDMQADIILASGEFVICECINPFNPTGPRAD